ncbi:MAG TPA: GNAT family N-acetyltransferase [Trebonia sp.]|jgi:GNAT superfamily N-acetyltransferase
MRIVEADPSDPATAQACFEVVRTAGGHDDPDGPPWSLRRMRGWLEFPSDPAETWTCVEESGGAVHGWYYLVLHERENRDKAYLHLTVHPAWRRRGTGSALLGHALGRAAARGRSALGGGAFQDSAGAAFAGHVGAVPGLAEARRVLRLGQIPPGRVASLREQAARTAAGYSLVSWFGRTPEEYLARSAAVENAMNDAPHDAGEEPEIWDAGRVREYDDIRERRGRQIYTLAALHDASGAMAAVTAVETDPDNPAWAHQLLTAVTREHRGHRLGLLVKTAMLEWLATAEPAVEHIVTGNAAVNQHMIDINEQLGYELLVPVVQGYELSVAGALAAGAAGR